MPPQALRFPLSVVRQTKLVLRRESANDPKRTFSRPTEQPVRPQPVIMNRL
jgi:hypothetical protein